MGIKCDRCGTLVVEGDQYDASEWGWDDVCEDCYDTVAEYSDDEDFEDEDESVIWDGEE
ncbi:hypothetical protein CPT_Muldoon_186 [Serratia phage Muldoon]|uniref:Uncharacterized protein n=1 Tax=Serratia phage Muldoon TaxID=2601678 RepID=A0A5P8PHE7_9CAUD|nr:hypothetical protein HYP94_gp204 [Serratia phage Muldoon]QFR56137.1 hypothetical protein CPT_Muldoon_186 [Serratia phage Muldoon]UNA02295.1 hypothetical protein [Serratia phage SP1]